MQLRPVLLALGILTVLLAGAMVPCALLDMAQGNQEAHVFWVSAFICGLGGALLWVLARGGDPRIGQRETFILTVSIWVLMPAVAAIPFLVSGLSITDASFEAVSGLTTTGATVISGLETLPRGLLLWRGILNWIGGIGIIVTAIAILPQLRVGGMQLFQLESSDIAGKFLPRVTDIAAYMSLTYLIISVVCALSYGLSGMNWFDSVVHAMSTVSAGGFANYDASFAHENLRGAMPVAVFFMAVAGLPFSLMTMLVLQGRIRPLLRDPQPRLYFSLLVCFSAIILIWHELAAETPVFDHFLQGALETVFNIVSVMTGTGFSSAPYDTWGQPVVVVFLLVTFMGGCAGSASCGMKMFRLEITAKALVAWSQRMVQPHRRAPVRYAGRPVDEETLQSVMVFMFLYLVTFMVAAALLSYTGLDALTAISASATMVSNVGPGLGPTVGPSTNFAGLADFAKWICSAAMLLGRLEFVAVFVVLTGRFWRG